MTKKVDKAETMARQPESPEFLPALVFRSKSVTNFVARPSGLELTTVNYRLNLVTDRANLTLTRQNTQTYLFTLETRPGTAMPQLHGGRYLLWKSSTMFDKRSNAPKFQCAYGCGRYTQSRELDKDHATHVPIVRKVSAS